MTKATNPKVMLQKKLRELSLQDVQVQDLFRRTQSGMPYETALEIAVVRLAERLETLMKVARDIEMTQACLRREAA